MDVIGEIILLIGERLQVAALLAPFRPYWMILMGCLALASCFAGYKVFRVAGAVAAFFLTALGITCWMTGHASHGSVVTALSILGVIAAFAVYFHPPLSAGILCGLWGYALSGLATDIGWIRLLIALAAAACSIRWSGHVLILMSAIWGAFAAPEILDGWLPLTTGLRWLLSVLLALMGLAVQYGTNRQVVRLPDALLRLRLGYSVRKEQRP